MKPLELHIYDKHPDADAYRVGGFYSPYCLVSKDKRFTPGELAAEWWKQDGHCEQKLEGYGVSSFGEEFDTEEEETAKMEAIERACTLPHYDEADQEVYK